MIRSVVSVGLLISVNNRRIGMYISFLLLQLQVTWCPSYANGGTTTTLTSRGWGNLMGQKGIPTCCRTVGFL
ncbi:hypothetical protein FKM82_005613 [Ascaphus truei]